MSSIIHLNIAMAVLKIFFLKNKINLGQFVFRNYKIDKVLIFNYLYKLFYKISIFIFL